MKRTQLITIAAMACVAVLTLSGRGQQAPPPPAAEAGGFNVMLPPPLMRLEALAAQKGVLIIKGFTDIGTINGEDGSSVVVSAVQFSDGTSKEAGVAVHVSQPFEGRTLTTTAHIEAGELDGLIAAIESLARLQEDASPLQQFEARYQTQGALELTSANVNGGRMILVRAMQILPGIDQPAVATSQIFVSRLPELGQRLKAAKETLDKLK